MVNSLNFSVHRILLQKRINEKPSKSIQQLSEILPLNIKIEDSLQKKLATLKNSITIASVSVKFSKS
jgi:hypothetical protein